MAPKQQNPESVSSKASWVLVMEEDQFTRDRTPQYNDVNESPAQMSADRVGQRHFGDAMSADDDGPSTIRKTISNTTETRTDHSFESQVGPTNSKTTAATPRVADPPKPSLSETALLLLTVGQPQGYPFVIHNWLAGTGGGLRIEESMSGSMSGISARTGKSKYSTASSISLGFAPVSAPTAMDHDVEGCGAIFWDDEA